ncbi:MAG: hypothetical protein IPI81_03420 [Flavobacteriales bacterium]|nr:hypothetical protein [Flavobacteriales bacterium]MCC6937712.1 hypothetical protein [Flavobacteriales bacterium]
MNKTTEYTAGVRGMVSLATAKNPSIGIYQEHFINGNFDYAVRLSNGRVVVSAESAQDFEAQPSSITDEMIQRVADSFKSL